MKELTLDCCL